MTYHALRILYQPHVFAGGTVQIFFARAIVDKYG